MPSTNGASLSSACNSYSFIPKTKTTAVKSGTFTIVATCTSTATTFGEPYTTTTTVQATTKSPVPSQLGCDSVAVSNDGNGPDLIMYNLCYTGCNVKDAFRDPAATRFLDGELGMVLPCTNAHKKLPQGREDSVS